MRLERSAKWAICLDSPGLLDDLQAVLTNLGVVHGRVSKANPIYGKTYDEVYAAGTNAQRLLDLVPFLEAHKSAAVATLLAAGDMADHHNTADVVPGITPAELYALVPYRQRNEHGVPLRTEFNFLADTPHAARDAGGRWSVSLRSPG